MRNYTNEYVGRHTVMANDWHGCQLREVFLSTKDNVEGRIYIYKEGSK